MPLGRGRRCPTRCRLHRVMWRSSIAGSGATADGRPRARRRLALPSLTRCAIACSALEVRSLTSSRTTRSHSVVRSFLITHGSASACGSIVASIQAGHRPDVPSGSRLCSRSQALERCTSLLPDGRVEGNCSASTLSGVTYSTRAGGTRRTAAATAIAVVVFPAPVEASSSWWRGAPGARNCATKSCCWARSAKARVGSAIGALRQRGSSQLAEHPVAYHCNRRPLLVGELAAEVKDVVAEAGERTQPRCNQFPAAAKQRLEMLPVSTITDNRYEFP